MNIIVRYRFLRIRWQADEKMTAVLAQQMKPTERVIGVAGFDNDRTVLLIQDVLHA